MTAIIIDSSERDLILIDEPELSLNIKWQNELVPLLMESAPNSQIILATHSPSIVNDHIEFINELI